jgi:hypothetical protein
MPYKGGFEAYLTVGTTDGSFSPGVPVHGFLAMRHQRSRALPFLPSTPRVLVVTCTNRAKKIFFNWLKAYFIDKDH